MQQTRNYGPKWQEKSASVGERAAGRRACLSEASGDERDESAPKICWRTVLSMGLTAFALLTTHS